MTLKAVNCTYLMGLTTDLVVHSTIVKGNNDTFVCSFHQCDGVK